MVRAIKKWFKSKVSKKKSPPPTPVKKRTPPPSPSATKPRATTRMRTAPSSTPPGAPQPPTLRSDKILTAEGYRRIMLQRTK